jgi:hypothetical protein
MPAFDHIGERVRIGWFRHILGGFIHTVVEQWIVAPAFFEQIDDLGEFPFTEDSQFQRQLLTVLRQLVIPPLRRQDQDGKAQRGNRGQQLHPGKWWRVDRCMAGDECEQIAARPKQHGDQQKYEKFGATEQLDHADRNPLKSGRGLVVIGMELDSRADRLFDVVWQFGVWSAQVRNPAVMTSRQRRRSPTVPRARKRRAVNAGGIGTLPSFHGAAGQIRAQRRRPRAAIADRIGPRGKAPQHRVWGWMWAIHPQAALTSSVGAAAPPQAPSDPRQA